MSESFWDKYATEFDAIYGTKNSALNSLINKLFRKAMRQRFEKTISNIPDEKVSVLDIGCGPGHYCFCLAKSGRREITGIDFSEQMIQLAQDYAVDLNLTDKVKFNLVDIYNFDPGRKFDYSIMMGFLEYFNDPEVIIKKVLAITTRKVFISLPVAGGLLGLQRKLRYRKRCYLKMYRYSDVEDLLIRANINSFSIERITRDFYITINLC